MGVRAGPRFSEAAGGMTLKVVRGGGAVGASCPKRFRVVWFDPHLPAVPVANVKARTHVQT